ncbi:zinc-binding dehydrogenase [Sphaerisporangium sp. TRM90804]|uniref:zinc-binding dehydrogenase n=1 Tax=Sphaerisporangium sp. TRM90804 TaxID=3031113 RepID=UPI00244CA2E3|nr:zinc-binding dehydrogenase [Sphaerisporangium sp. TRM90804]MDH2429744.1 zinc-binding dehydrogenase [Sphaerisporangium sp. TRM90804]
MRVAQVTRFGEPEVLVSAEAPDPEAGPGQVVAEVAAADVLFVETQIRRGGQGAYFGFVPPYVPGGGASGRVVSTGPGVDPAWAGRRVLVRTGNRGGGYAERVPADLGEVLPVPDGLGLREAASLTADAVTGLGLVENARLQPGQWVLVLGAAGGMGVLLVQLARAAGARVVAAARGRRKLDLVDGLGAEVSVDYSRDGWVEAVREATGGKGVDVVFDGAGGTLGVAAFGLVAPGGLFSAHGAPSGGFAPVDAEEARRRGIALRGIADLRFAPDEAVRLLRRALTEAAEGRIRPVIGQTFPLAEAAAAHAAIESRDVVGKTLLLP